MSILISRSHIAKIKQSYHPPSAQFLQRETAYLLYKQPFNDTRRSMLRLLCTSSNELYTRYYYFN